MNSIKTENSAGVVVSRRGAGRPRRSSQFSRRPIKTRRALFARPLASRTIYGKSWPGTLSRPISRALPELDEASIVSQRRYAEAPADDRPRTRTGMCT
ncbi:hypothetical protein EVAR_35318_1 [Eumeta japonica]|uniref:Uncharacterized protein n=1 Tax=Eumeta variegata TaxID=151549 RepID=A0A4C1XJ25_EUMVA|nr:hypothetical protein EVAR_35318_1 [Eumeta japonica]